MRKNPQNSAHLVEVAPINQKHLEVAPSTCGSTACKARRDAVLKKGVHGGTSEALPLRAYEAWSVLAPVCVGVATDGAANGLGLQDLFSRALEKQLVLMWS